MRWRGRPTAVGLRSRRTAREDFTNPHIVALSGGEARPISFLPNGGTGSLAWSPDGTYLLFATSQRTEDSQIARIDLIPRTPRFREDQFRDLFQQQPSRPGTPTDPAPRQAPPQRDSATIRADSTNASTRGGTRIVFDDIRRRITILPVGVDARAVIISPDGKTALISAAAAGQANLYTYSLDELAAQQPVARQLTSTPGLQGQPAVHRRQSRGLLRRERPDQCRSTSNRAKAARST